MADLKAIYGIADGLAELVLAEAVSHPDLAVRQNLETAASFLRDGAGRIYRASQTSDTKAGQDER